MTRNGRTKNPYYSGEVSDHFDGVRFFNPGYSSTDRSLTEVLRWRLGEKRAPWPVTVPVRQAMPETRVDRLRITAVGHASTLIQIEGLNILTDPVWSDRTSPFSFAGPKRVAKPGIAFDSLPPIDAVLISHNHYDHLDIVTLKRLKSRDNPLMVMPLGNDAIVRRAIPDARIATGDWDDVIPIKEKLAVTLTPANHWSARGLGDRRMALWSGYFIKTATASVWFAGDTGYGNGAIFRAIRERYGAPQVALIPIGAYEPRWFMTPQHVNPAEAVAIFRDIGATHALGIHWGTFQLTDEAREAPVEALAEALAAARTGSERFKAAGPGEVFEFD